MCLIININSRIRTAKEDIVVYKYFNKDSSLTTPYMNYVYKVNKLYVTTIVIDKIKFTECIFFDEIVLCNYNINGYVKEISDGFHSVSELRRVNRYNHKTIRRCIIPKGSKYYKDKTDLIVSNQIIIKEIYVS